MFYNLQRDIYKAGITLEDKVIYIIDGAFL